MSIQSEINRILHFRDQSFEEVRNKGVTIPQDAIIDDLPDYIAQIQTGSGGTGAISVVDTPDAAGGTVRTITAVDISDTTAVASDVASGKYFYSADGTKTAGTASGGGATLITKNITANGTYNASSDNADGYSSVTVNVSGGGGGGVSPKQVNFIDYDGTILYSYTAQEANALSALPANPSHSGLTAQGWNWTLAQIKAQLTAMPDGPVWVGQMYITQSGDTEIDVSMQAGRLSPILTIAVNGTITVDWGDNTSADTVTGSSLTTRKAVPHTYAAPGDYTIKIHVVSGSFSFYGSSSYLLLRKNTNSGQSRVYSNCVKAVRLGSGITSIAGNAFYYCCSLAYITIPNTITSIDNYSFYYCHSLASVTISSSVTSIGNQAFQNCYGLSSVAIPSGVTSVGVQAFYYCVSLLSITIPSGVTSIGNSAFAYCGIVSLIIPSGVASVEPYMIQNCSCLSSITIPSGVTSIGTSSFQNCYGLASLTLPSTLTSIGDTVFSNCSGIKEYHVLPTTPPTLGSSAFGSIATDCVIYVPSAKLNDYKTATNWSTYASYMQGE